MVGLYVDLQVKFLENKAGCWRVMVSLADKSTKVVMIPHSMEHSGRDLSELDAGTKVTVRVPQSFVSSEDLIGSTVYAPGPSSGTSMNG
jgi:hypothetical protein